MSEKIAGLALALSILFAAPAAAEPGASAPAPQQTQSNADRGSARQDSMSEKRKKAGEVMRQMLTPETVVVMESTAPSTRFGGEFPRLAYENAYLQLWTRPGLSLKERSLVTIGILIGIGNDKELATHFASGLRNGLTPKQLEEIVYQATAYAGFPAASRALAIASEVVAQEGK